MNKWAASGVYDANFLCICVVGDASGGSQLAKEFGKQMKLKDCVNGFVASDRDMPNYGQLGCNGFIVLDGSHRVVSKCTTSFNEVRDLAFHHVETLLHALIRQEPIPKVCPGEFIRISSPPCGQEKYMGERGVCLGWKDGRAKLQLIGKSSRGVNIEVDPSVLRKITSDGRDVVETGAGYTCGQSEPGSGECKTQHIGSAVESSCGTCEQSDAILDKSFLEGTLGAICSVKVEAMDAEHEECASLMYELVAKKSIDSLIAVGDHLEEHFRHEEKLFDKHGWGAHKNENLSAKKTHVEDHKRILNKISAVLDSNAKSVPVVFIRELLQDFHNHTTRYDSQYADELSVKCATSCTA